MKDKKSKRLIYNIILTVSILIFVVSGAYLLYRLVLVPAKNKTEVNEIQQIYHNEDTSDNGDKVVWPQNIKNLKEINPDIVGWINVPDTVIDYPVLQPPESSPSFYLRKNYKKEYLLHGSIFIDVESSLDKNTQNTIVYGHNMYDGSMFHEIVNYTNDLDFYKKRPFFSLDTETEQRKYKIISAFRTNTTSNYGEPFIYLRPSFKNKDDFLNFIYQVRLRSFINTPVDINENDKIITLSTCSYEMKDFRTAIVARLVRDGESTDVDVSLATKNPQPLLPDAYYSKYGTTPPVVTDFKTALSKGEISWYKEN